MTLTTALAFWGRHWLTQPDLVMLYLLPIMGVAYRFGQSAALATSALSVAAFDFFFVHPYFTFAVSDSQYLLTFSILFVVGLVISGLMTRIRAQERNAREQERQTDGLYQFGRELLSTLDPGKVPELILRHACRLFGGATSLWLTDATGTLTLAAANPPGCQPQEDGLVVIRWCCEQRQAAGQGTPVFPDTAFTALPITTGRLAGAITIRFDPRRPPGQGVRPLLDAFARHASLAMDRARLGEEAESAAVRVRTEEMRSTLLSMASHDLRTPLASITGAGTTLRDEGATLDNNAHAELLATICTEAERMERLITNLLDMVRLESGSCPLRLEWIPFEELIGAARVRLAKSHPDQPIAMTIEDQVALIHVDPVLFEHVVVNLLENALKHATSAHAITWKLHMEGNRVVMRIGDRGPGIPAGMEEAIFEKFVRNARPGVPGSGLGLAICRAVIQAHRGTIHALNRPRGGVEFRIELPQPDLPADLLPAANPDRPAPEKLTT